MIQAATVSTVHDDSFKAGRLAAAELFDTLGAQPDLALLFAAPRYEHARVLEGIYSVLAPSARLVGCSSYAEINSEEGLSGSVTMMGMRLGGVEARTFKIAGIGADPRAGGNALGAEVKAFAPDLLVLLSGGLINVTRLVLGLQDMLGPTFPIVGGLSCDDARFVRTFQLYDREVISGGRGRARVEGLGPARGRRAQRLAPDRRGADLHPGGERQRAPRARRPPGAGALHGLPGPPCEGDADREQ